MLTVRALPMNGTEPGEENPFVSLEDTPIVLADIRAALPQLRKSLMARWPAINAVEIENRRITRRRNPHDHTQVFANAILGIQIYIFSRPARIFLEETAREAAKEVGPVIGRQIVEMMEHVKKWLKRLAHGAPKKQPLLRKRIRPALPKKVKKQRKSRQR